MLVWPRPPFQPWTATTVVPVLMMLSRSAFRRPKRIRLSTYEAILSVRRPFHIHILCRSDAHVRLPLVWLDAARLGVPEGVAASVQVKLTSSLLVARDYRTGESIANPGIDAERLTSNDGNRRTVLGDKSCGVSTGRQNDDRAGVLL